MKANKHILRTAEVMALAEARPGARGYQKSGRRNVQHLRDMEALATTHRRLRKSGAVAGPQQEPQTVGTYKAPWALLW